MAAGIFLHSLLSECRRPARTKDHEVPRIPIAAIPVQEIAIITPFGPLRQARASRALPTACRGRQGDKVADAGVEGLGDVGGSLHDMSGQGADFEVVPVDPQCEGRGQVQRWVVAVSVRDSDLEGVRFFDGCDLSLMPG